VATEFDSDIYFQLIGVGLHIALSASLNQLVH